MTDQTKPMDAERLAEMRQRAEAATPGPWVHTHADADADSPLGDIPEMNWVASADAGDTPNGDVQFLIDCYGGSANADFIAASRQDVPYLLDLVDSLSAERDALADRVDALRDDLGRTVRSRDEWEGNYIDSAAERDEYRRALRYLVGNEWEEAAGDTLSEKAMSTVIDRQASELAALRAVVEEARDEIESWKINANLEVVANEAAVLAILDRGLKGENNG